MTENISLMAKIEAILYLKAEPLALKDIVEMVKEDRKAVKQALSQMMSDYATRETALEIVKWIANIYYNCEKPTES
jgi:segregation and condensation protein B